MRQQRARLMNNITGHNGIRVNVTSRGIEIYGNNQAGQKRLFSLYDVGSKTVKVRGDITDEFDRDGIQDTVENLDKAVYLNGASVSHTVDQPFDTDIDLEAYTFSQGVTDDTHIWLYLLVDYSSSGSEFFSLKITLDQSDLIPSNDQRIFPLHYITWNASGDKIDQILDLRDTVHIDTGDAAPDDNQYAFKIQRASTGTTGNIDVLVGTVYRNDTTNIAPALTDQNIPASSTKAVYLLLDRPSDSELSRMIPSDAELVIENVGTHNPQDPEVFLVGTVTTNSSGEITDIFQTWLGYVDDQWSEGDSYWSSTDTQSIERTPNRLWRIRNFNDPATYGPGSGVIDSSDYFMINHDAGGGVRDVRYPTLTQTATAIGGAIPPGTVRHADLDYTNDTGPDPTKTANDDHDGRYWFYVTAGVATNSFHTTGECHADDFVIQDRTANLWNAEGFTADVTAAITLLAATTLNATATGKMTLTGNSNTGTEDMLLQTSGAASQLKIDAAALFYLTGADAMTIESTANNGSNDLLLNTTGVGSMLHIAATNEYRETIGGDCIVDGNTAVDDTASGVGHGRVISLSGLANNNENKAAIWAYSVA